MIGRRRAKNDPGRSEGLGGCLVEVARGPQARAHQAARRPCEREPARRDPGRLLRDADTARRRWLTSTYRSRASSRSSRGTRRRSRRSRRRCARATSGSTRRSTATSIRIPLPPLTEERRKEFVKIARKYGEECKVAIRKARHDALDMLDAARNRGGSERGRGRPRQEEGRGDGAGCRQAGRQHDRSQRKRHPRGVSE